jgi:hypothetical protein
LQVFSSNFLVDLLLLNRDVKGYSRHTDTVGYMPLIIAYKSDRLYPNSDYTQTQPNRLRQKQKTNLGDCDDEENQKPVCV